MAFRDPRHCLRDFFQTGRNLGKRPPSFSFRNVQRDTRAVSTSIGNIGRRLEGAIGAAARGDFLPGQILSIGNEFRCPPTHYASYFGQHNPPKFKFMFFVEISIDPVFNQAFGEPWSEGEVWWFVKEMDRPRVNYSYEEVNMYNFKTKVVTRAHFEPLSMVMYDDMSDVTNGFWNSYIRIMSPITNTGSLPKYPPERLSMQWDKDIYQFDRQEPEAPQIGINRFTNAEGAAIAPSRSILFNSSSTGALPGLAGNEFRNNIIEFMFLHHIIDWGQQIVSYLFRGVRIENIQMDQLTWESSEPCEIEVQFSYDSFEIYYPSQFLESDVSGDKIPSVYPINPQYDDFPFGF